MDDIDDEQTLHGMRIAIIATDMVEESELIEPRLALERAGAETELVGLSGNEIITANHHDKAESYPLQTTVYAAEPTDYDALLLPGGALNADALRVDHRVQRFVQDMDAAGKPIAIICHAPWILISAGLAEGRTLTGYHTIADDIENAGGIWADEAVVVDENWVSSRQPDDIPQFNEAVIALFGRIYAAGLRPA